MGRVLVGGIISCLSREAKMLFLGHYLAEGIIRCLVFANFG